MNYLNTNSPAIMGYFPEWGGDTSGPYYARFELLRADERRMIGLEKAQNNLTLCCQIVLMIVYVLLFCFSL